MRLKLYQAAGVTEAMALIRAELGPDALILSTRRTPGGVEVTAALEPEDEVPPLVPVAPAPQDPARAAALGWHGVPPDLAVRLGAGPLAPALSAVLDFGALRLGQGEPPLLLTGPPGAGKTLTAARLATRLVMAGTPPLVITADGKRAGAVEQLAAFTRLLGLNLVVANHPVTLGRALPRRPEGAPVLIDAPGTDPFDPAQAEELRAFAAVAGAAIALVLPAGLDPGEAAELGQAYAALGATMLVATRLDLARRLGAVPAAAQAGGLALTEAGIGPGAADGLVPLTPALLADRLERAPLSGPRPPGCLP
jgi:flagellar biosynthesis protein FlhF